MARSIDRLGDDHGVRPGDVAMFYRTNAQSRAIEDVFVRVGLPYKVVGGTRFYERKEVKDALAYLRVLANPDDTSTCAASSTCPSAASATGPRPASAPSPSASASRSSPRSAAPRTPPASPPARSPPSRASPRCSRTSAGCATTDAGVADLLEAVLEQTGYLTELRASRDPQDETRRREPRRAGRRGPRVRRGAPRDRRGVASRTSSSRSPSWPTPTRSPTPRRPRRPGSSR